MGDARVYIDGFNLYYGALRGTQYKWLNIHALMQRLLPQYDIQGILYGTAPVRPMPWDPDVPTRQRAYLDAIALLPTVEVLSGTYSQKLTKMPMLNPSRLNAPCDPGDYPRVNVLKNEEKGTDVTLGARMVYDACTGACDALVLVSNDSDLFEPVRLVREKMGMTVIQVVPTRPSAGKHSGRKSVYTGRVDHVIHEINESLLRSCQLPDPFTIGSRTFSKPPTW